MSFSDALAELFMLILLSAIGLPAGAQSVTSSQYDNARSGANRFETALTPCNVNVRHFGKLFTLKVDGDVYSQPLCENHVAGIGRPENHDPAWSLVPGSPRLARLIGRKIASQVLT